MSSEIYISVDIEADGPIPGENSMLSMGAAAFSSEGKLLDTYSANLITLLGAKADPKTKAFWDKNPEAWEACRKNTRHPRVVMLEFNLWLKTLEEQNNGKVVFVGYPAGYDFTFVYWYLMKFAKYSPFSFSCIDIKTYAMAMLKKPYRKCTKRNMPKRWFKNCGTHNHIAVDDAVEQGRIFCCMLKESLEKDE